MALLVRGDTRGKSLPVGFDIRREIVRPLVLRQGDHDVERDRHPRLVAQARASPAALPIHLPIHRGLPERGAPHAVEQAVLVYVIEDRGRGQPADRIVAGHVARFEHDPFDLWREGAARTSLENAAYEDGE